MAAPTGADGWEQGVVEFLVPSGGVLFVVVVTREFAGPVVAGFVYLLLTAVVLLGIYTAALHWNVRYMAGFVVAGIVLLWLAPSVMSELVHPAFAVVGTLLVAVFLFGMVLLFLQKVGLDDLLDEF